MTYPVQCGHCEKPISEEQYQEIGLCIDCQEDYCYTDIEVNCKNCNENHKRTPELDHRYHNLCRDCFYKEFNNYKTPQKVIDKLNEFQKKYEQKHGRTNTISL